MPSISSMSSLWSMSFWTATGRTRSSTNWRTVSWIRRCSSVSSKSIGGSLSGLLEPRSRPSTIDKPWTEPSSSSRATCGCATTPPSPRQPVRRPRWCRSSSSTRRSSRRRSAAPPTVAVFSPSRSPTSTSRCGSSVRASSCAAVTPPPSSLGSPRTPSMPPRTRAATRRRASSAWPIVSTCVSIPRRPRLRSTT